MSDDDALRAAARSKDPSARWLVADDPDLPVEVMRDLLHDQEPQVIVSLLTNYGMPREVLEEARRLHPDRLDLIADHPNAPLDLAVRLPLWRHTYLSIQSYAQAAGLEAEVVDRVVQRWADIDRNDPVTLGDAVLDARS